MPKGLSLLKAIWARFIKRRQQSENMATLSLKLCDYHEHADQERDEMQTATQVMAAIRATTATRAITATQMKILSEVMAAQ
jgi:hypothetical protein